MMSSYLKKNIILVFFITVFVFTCKSQPYQGGSYYVGTDNHGGDVAGHIFSKLKDALEDIADKGLTEANDGDVILYLTDETYNEDPILVEDIENSGENNRVIIKPYEGVQPTVTFSNTAGSYGLKLKNISYFIIDGSNEEDGDSRDLTFTIENNGKVLLLAKTIDNLYIKNCVFIGDNNNISTNNAIIGTNSGENYKTNIVISNNWFYKAVVGIDFNITGKAEDIDKNYNLNIKNNLIGFDDYDGPTEKRISEKGIWVQGFTEPYIYNNEILNMSESSYAQAIHIFSTDEAVIENNTIYNIQSTGTSSAIWMPANNSNMQIINNNIRDIEGTAANGIYSILLDKSTIEGNVISEIIATGGNANGIYSRNGEENLYTRNRIYRVVGEAGETGGRGIYITNLREEGDLSPGENKDEIISNNKIYGIGGKSSSSGNVNVDPFGILINSTNISGLIKIYHNSVYLTENAITYSHADEDEHLTQSIEPTGLSAAIGFNTGDQEDVIDMRNNIFYNLLASPDNFAAGYSFAVVLYGTTNPFSECDYNIYKNSQYITWCGWPDIIASVNGGVLVHDLDAWKDFTGGDNNSIFDGNNCSDDPPDVNRFKSIGDLNIYDNKYEDGDNQVGIEIDFWGNPRSDPPKIGATESYVSLPVELWKFTADKQNRQINLNWITLSEINNDYFILQKSKDCKEFYDIDYVLGNGTTSYINYYSSIDYNPYIGDNYYRLKQVDYDGTTEYSKIIHEFYNSIPDLNNTLKVYPNPFSDKIHVTNYTRQM